MPQGFTHKKSEEVQEDTGKGRADGVSCSRQLHSPDLLPAQRILPVCRRVQEISEYGEQAAVDYEAHLTVSGKGHLPY